MGQSQENMAALIHKLKRLSYCLFVKTIVEYRNKVCTGKLVDWEGIEEHYHTSSSNIKRER